MFLSDQIGAKNFRIRESLEGYQTEWHLAGDATLIAVLQGCLRITLRNGQNKDFGVGDVFISADDLPPSIAFDADVHGHKAEVIGHETLRAIHIKLDGFKID